MKKKLYKYFIYCNIMNDEKEPTLNETEMIDDTSYDIKHLVISGGGTYGLAAYGALRELHKHGKWDLQNIQSCHGTSIGTCILLMVLFGYDWETLDKFLIDRPWKHVFNFDWSHFLSIYDNCGVFTLDNFKQAWEPLFLGADLSIHLTLKELYDKTKIDFFIYSAEINGFELASFSHKTHPSMKLLEACYCSCSLPILFKPLSIEGKYYVDGGIFLNYPIQQCLELSGAHKKEVLGIRKVTIHNDKHQMNSETNLMEYILLLVRNMLNNIKHVEQYECVPNEICIEMETMDFQALQYFVESAENRRIIIQKGVQSTEHLLGTMD